MDALVTTPWQTLIVEAHEGESEDQFSKEVGDLCARTGSRVAARSLVKDGDSASRQLVVLARSQT